MILVVPVQRVWLELPLCNNLKNIRDGKNRTRPNIEIDEIYEYDLDSTDEELDEYCAKADFVFNLAGVNRPENPEDFMKGNFGFASQLLDTLKKHNNKAAYHAFFFYTGYLGRHGLEIVNMADPRRRERSCSSHYGEETGATVVCLSFSKSDGPLPDQSIIPLFLLSAGQWQMMKHLQ